MEKQKILDVGYILGNGNVVGVDQLKALTDDKITSQQIKPDTFNYDKDKCVAPPYNLTSLIQLLDDNPEHSRCVRAKATDVIGQGYKVVKDPKLKESQVKEAQKEELENFYQISSFPIPFLEMLNRMTLDLETTGNGYIEVARNVKGYPAALYHVDVTTIRVREDHEGYLQKKDNKTVYFQNFGDKIVLDDTGKITKRNFIDPKTGKEKNSLGIQQSANEIIHFKYYKPGNQYYGGPDYISALKPIIGSGNAEDYNIQFFENNAIPQYAILVKGAKLSAELKSLIEMYFRTEIRGKAHKTLILSIPHKNVELEFKPLSVETKEGSFEKYRNECRDRILVAHGVPPHRVGIIETASLGSGTGEAQNETYKRSILEPRQRIIEAKFDIVNQLGFGIKGWLFKFDDIDFKDQKNQAEIAKIYKDMGAMTIDEVRTEFLGKQAFEKGGDRPYIIVGNQIYFLDELGEVEAEEKVLEEIQTEYKKILAELEN